MSEDQKDLLKKLVDAPYGQAETILKERGLWDEKRRHVDGDPRSFRVKVTGEMRVSSIIKVTARSAEEAEELAVDEAHSSGFIWDTEDDIDCVEAEVEE